MLSRWRLALVGAALLLAGTAAILIASAFGGTPEMRAGHDAPVNAGAGSLSDISAHNSPTLARNPVRPANFAISNRIDTPRFGCALHVSFDGGLSWRQTPIPVPRGEEPKCFAPDVAFGADGTLYLSFVTLKGRGNVPHAVWISTSQDGGRTLSRPRRVLGHLAFQVRLATDPLRPGRLYLTWLQAKEVGTLKFLAPGNPIMSLRSEDGARSWGRPMRVSDPGRGRVVTPAPAVGPKGELYILYLDLGGDRLDYEGGHRGRGGPPYDGFFKLVLARSPDRGRTWEESVVDRKVLPIRRFVVFFPPFPSLAVDRRSGRVYASFHDARLGDPDVWLWSLPAGSSSWQGPRRVNDTAEHDGTSQYLPKLDVAPNGRLDVLYYDRRGDRRDVMNQVSLQSSIDSGKSFTPAVRLSSRRFDSRVGFGAKEGLPDLGSRLGLISEDSRALAVWTDTRAGTRLTQKQDLARALVAFSEPPRLSDPIEYGLRYGGIALVLGGVAVLGLAVFGSRPRGRLPVARAGS